MAENKDRVDLESADYEAMSRKWELLHDLLGGTLAMRDAGTKWLPMEPRESVQAYDARLGRSVLYEAFKDTIQKLVAKPFSKPVKVQDGLPARLEMMEDNIDRNGRDITVFAKDLFQDAVTHGLTHFLVDYPVIEGPIRLDVARKLNINPFFTHLSPKNIIGWRSRKGIGGEEVLSQIRICYSRYEPSGSYGEELVTYYRVIDETKWELWKKTESSDEAALVGGGPNRFPGGRIPLVTIYLDQTGFMKADPVLEGLGWLNLSHWQVSSDVRNAIRFASVGMWSGTGITEDELEKGFEIGPARFLGSTNENAEFGVVEAKGTAIEIAEKHIQGLEARMEVLGLQPYMRKTGTITATGRAIDESRNQSNILSWIRRLESGLELGYKYSGEWVRLENQISDDFGVDIFSEFSLSMAAEKDLEILLKMALNDRIPNDVFLMEVQRRGTLSDIWDVEDLDERRTQTVPPDTDDEDLDDDGGEEPSEEGAGKEEPAAAVA